MPGDFCDFGQRGLKGMFGGLTGLAVQLLLQRVDFVLGENPFAEQAHLHLDEWIAHGVGLALGRGAVEPVIVRERVGVGPHAVAVNKGRSEAGAAVRYRGLEGAQAGFGIGAIHLGKVEVGEVGHQPGDVSAGRVHLDRSADGVAVVFHAEDDGQLLVGGGVERLPELALRGGTLAERSKHDLVAMKLDVAKGAVVALGFTPQRRRPVAGDPGFTRLRDGG